MSIAETIAEFSRTVDFQLGKPVGQDCGYAWEYTVQAANVLSRFGDRRDDLFAAMLLWLAGLSTDSSVDSRVPMAAGLRLVSGVLEGRGDFEAVSGSLAQLAPTMAFCQEKGALMGYRLLLAAVADVPEHVLA